MTLFLPNNLSNKSILIKINSKILGIWNHLWMKHSNMRTKIMESLNSIIYRFMTDKCNKFLFKTHRSLQTMPKKHKAKSRMLKYCNYLKILWMTKITINKMGIHKKILMNYNHLWILKNKKNQIPIFYFKKIQRKCLKMKLENLLRW